MFDIGFSELVMVALVSLLVVGPERLPKAARFLGFWLGKMRSMMLNAKAEFEHELQIEEMRQLLTEQSGMNQVQQLTEELSATTEAIKNSLSGEEIYAMYHTRANELKQLVQEGVIPPTTTDAPTAETASETRVTLAKAPTESSKTHEQD